MDIQFLKSEPLSKRGQRRIRRNLFGAFIEACSTHGANTPILTDGDGRVLSYSDLRRAAFALSTPLKGVTAKRESVGIMLPTGAGAVIALLSIQAAGRVPAMLNFTAGVKNI